MTGVRLGNMLQGAVSQGVGQCGIPGAGVHITLRNRITRWAEFLGPEPAWEVLAALCLPWGNPFMWSVRFCLSQPSLPHPRHLGLLRASALPDPMPPCICSPFGISTLRGWVPAVNRPVIPGDTPLTVASADLTSILLAGMKALGGRGAAWFVVRGASHAW